MASLLFPDSKVREKQITNERTFLFGTLRRPFLNVAKNSLRIVCYATYIGLNAGITIFFIINMLHLRRATKNLNFCMYNCINHTALTQALSTNILLRLWCTLDFGSLHGQR